MLLNQFVYPPKVGTTKTPGLREFNWIEPELCISLRLLDMDMASLMAFTAKEEEADSMNSKNLRHK